MHPKRVTYGSHPSAFMHIYGSLGDPKTQPLVMLLHGGFWKEKYDLELMAPMAENLAAAGCVVANVEYPRVTPNNDGPTVMSMLNSIYSSYDMLVTQLPYHNRTVVGHSAGGYYALMLATRKGSTPPPTMAIAHAPITDLWLGQERELSDDGDAIARFVNAGTDIVAERTLYDALSPAHQERVHCPVHIFHGHGDTDVPLEHSTPFRDRFINCGHSILLHDKNMDGNGQPIGDFGHYEVIGKDQDVFVLRKQRELILGIK